MMRRRARPAWASSCEVVPGLCKDRRDRRPLQRIPSFIHRVSGCPIVEDFSDPRSGLLKLAHSLKARLNDLHSTRMMRFVSSLLVALALLFSPLAMSTGGAAAASDGTPAVMTANSPCAGPAAPSENDHSNAAFSCAMICAAVPAAETVTREPLSILQGKPAVLASQMLIGVAPEGESPPPRMTPEI